MKNLLNKLTIFACFALLITATIGEAQTARFISYHVIDSGWAAITSPKNLIIRSQAQWQDFYKEASAGQNSQPLVPVIDFSKQQVVVVASGSQPTGGYATLISSVYNISGTIQVDAVLLNPDECVVTQAITYPSAIFVMPKTNKPFQFNIGNANWKCN